MNFARRFIHRHPCLSFSCLVVGTPYVVLLPLLAAGVSQDGLKPLKLLFALTPVIYACLVMQCTEGDRGVETLLGRFWNAATPVHLYFVGTLIFVAIGFVSLGLRYLVDGFFPARDQFASWSTIAGLSIPLLAFPGFTEEFAWRGLLQFRLQRNMHWWWASFLVGIVWGAWHGFDFLLGNWTFDWETFRWYPFFIIGNSLIIGWVFQRSGGNVFAAMLSHFSSNCVNFYMPVFEEYHGSALPAIFYIGGIWLVAIVLPMVTRPGIGGRRVRASSLRKATTSADEA